MIKQLIENVTRLYDVLTKVSTGTPYDDPQLITNFLESRSFLMENIQDANLIPFFVKKYRDLPSYWGFIKDVSPTYSGRREYLADAFYDLFASLENPADYFPLYSVFSGQEPESYILELWKKSVTRRELDPEGAITTSRTMVEATCKEILDSYNVSIAPNEKLSKLLKKTLNVLNIAPNPETKGPFRQLMSGSITIIEGLSSTRNKASDSHAISNEIFRPETKHSTLCVSLAGSICEFLLTTFYDQIPF